MPNVPTPVPLNGVKMNSIVIRENTEDLYMGLGEITEEGRLTTSLNLERGGYSLRGKLELATSPEVPFAVWVYGK